MIAVLIAHCGLGRSERKLPRAHIMILSIIPILLHPRMPRRRPPPRHTIIPARKICGRHRGSDARIGAHPEQAARRVRRSVRHRRVQGRRNEASRIVVALPSPDDVGVYDAREQRIVQCRIAQQLLDDVDPIVLGGEGEERPLLLERGPLVVFLVLVLVLLLLLLLLVVVVVLLLLPPLQQKCRTELQTRRIGRSFTFSGFAP